MIVVSLSNKTQQLRVELAGGLAKFAGKSLQHWSSTETAYFAEQPALAIPAGAPLTLRVPAHSVVTISNRQQKAGWASYVVPERTRFPLPFDGSVWESQPIDAPCINSKCVCYLPRCNFACHAHELLLLVDSLFLNIMQATQCMGHLRSQPTRRRQLLITKSASRYSYDRVESLFENA